MSTTTTLNPASGKNKPSGKNFASHAAIAVTGAGMGAAGATVASELGMDTEQEELTHETCTEEITEPVVLQQDETQTVETNEAPGNAIVSDASQQVVEVTETEILEAGPIPAVSDTPEAMEEVTEVTEPSEVISTEEPLIVVEEESVADVEPQEASLTMEEQGHLAAAEEQVESAPIPAGEVNPDEIAEAIIAEEQIDPADIDMADVIDFDEIGTVYTVEGESYTAAAFHDSVGNQLVMVDVDDDGVFDIITDVYGNPITDGAGNYMAAGGTTVDDAELDLSEEGTYLAENGGGTTEEFGTESISQDIITT